MSLFSDLSMLWASKAEARAREARREGSLTAFRVLHRINWSAPWDLPRNHKPACIAD
jgi:hypothetical protein